MKLTVYHYLRDFPLEESAPYNTGMDKAVAGLAGGIIDATGGELRSVVLCEGPRDLDFTRPEGFRVRCFDNHDTAQKRFGLAGGLANFVANEMQPGVVVLNAIFHPSVFLMARLLRRHGVSYVAAPHDPYHPAIFSTNSLRKRVYWHFCERPMLRGAAGVQVLDARHGELLRELKVSTPSIEVCNGFAPADVPDETSLRWRNPRDAEASVLFLGRMDRANKGIDLLIDAFARLATRHPKVQLTIQGPDRNGEDRPLVVQQVAERNLIDRVRILKPDYDLRPGDIAAKHDLFVLPSRFEGFGLSAMEAMLAARPVVVTDIAGLAPHVRKANCGLVADASPESLAAAIHALLKRRAEWKDMGLRGRRYVLDHLNWKSIAEHALKEYRRLNALTDPPKVPRTAHVSGG